jgi:hypothetical protein
MLVNNPRFQKEYRDFAEQVAEISDETVKTQLTLLLNKLLGEVKAIDRQHEELSRGSKLASESMVDHRSSLQSTRLQIIKKIKECKNTGLLKK